MWQERGFNANVNVSHAGGNAYLHVAAELKGPHMTNQCTEDGHVAFNQNVGLGYGEYSARQARCHDRSRNS